MTCLNRCYRGYDMNFTAYFKMAMNLIVWGKYQIEKIYSIDIYPKRSSLDMLKLINGS